MCALARYPDKMTGVATEEPEIPMLYGKRSLVKRFHHQLSLDDNVRNRNGGGRFFTGSKQVKLFLGTEDKAVPPEEVEALEKAT